MGILSEQALRIFRLFAVSACLLPVGCTTFEPLDQTYAWRPLGIYQANIAAMAERKSDLSAGRPLGPDDGHEAADAVQRWRDGKVRPLSTQSISDVRNNSDGSSGNSGGSQGGGD